MSIEQHWVDIVPPAPPASALEPLPLLIAAALVVLLIVLALIARRHPRRRARRTLRRLARDLRRARIGGKPACRLIRHCLCSAFGQRRLQAVTWPGDEHAAWQAYCDRLGRCAFATQASADEALQALVREALAWLDKRPVEP